MELLGMKNLAQKIAADPDDEPTAGNVPTREQRLETALRDMMAAYERRVRSECRTLTDLQHEPWRCMEFVAAEQALQSREDP